jgi:iron(III) transport system ATP-binding protein
MVFQSYALWPHMTVFDNVAFPLRMQRRNWRTQSAIRQRVLEVLELVNLAHLVDRPAPALSGGQQQRVALARALVANPKVLLLDEPLSNLDAQLRGQMRLELRRLTRELHMTSLYVTHDQIEAVTMSDRVGVMHDGDLVQEGGTVEIYRRPSTAFVAKFLGTANLIRGTLVGSEPDCPDEVVVDSAVGRLRCAATDLPPGAVVDVVIRPENLRLGREDEVGDFNYVTAVVMDTMFVGSYVHCELDADGIRLTAHEQSHEDVSAAQSRVFRFRPQWASVVPTA